MNEIRNYFSRGWTVSLSIAACLIFINCATSLREPIQVQDYSHVGFLSDHVFQFTIRAEADNSALGLVERRDSSLANAEKNKFDLITRMVADHLVGELVKKNAISTQAADEIRGIFMNRTGKFTQHADRVAEYYDKEEAVSLVYRIKRKNLKSEMKSLQLKVLNELNSSKTGDNR